jgi:Mg2+-importing ATPase
MTTLPASVLPKRIPHGPHKAFSAIQVSPLLLEAAGSEPEEVMQKLHTSKGGLSGEEAERRLKKYGPNGVLLAPANQVEGSQDLCIRRRNG